MASTGIIPFLFQNQGVTYDELNLVNFKVAVIDNDDAKLSSPEISTLTTAGKTLYAYLSIGEAEDYRAYWTENDWSVTPPAFLLQPNPDWQGTHLVKFWDPAWQKIAQDGIVSLAQAGYNGVYLDVVDAYTDPGVISAYDNASTATDEENSTPGVSGDIQQDMRQFVTTLSNSAKAINPGFKIIQNNALDLLEDPENPDAPNRQYLSAIDGVGVETGHSHSDNQALMQMALAAGKPVFAIDYTTDPAAQQNFINSSAEQGIIPFVGNNALDGTFLSAEFLT